MTRKQSISLTVLSVAAFVLAFLISHTLWFRMDLTQNKVYTISEVSRNLAAEIADQVLLSYYVSDRLAAVESLPGEIEDFLREYAAYSNGRVRLSVKDPVKAGLAQEVEALGVMPQQIETLEADQASVATVYSGLVIEYLDRVEVMPLVFSLETLEYELTSRIRAMVRGIQRELGVILGDAAMIWEEDYGYLAGALSQAGYQLRLIAPGDDIPDTLPALLVIGGMEALDERALYRIDRYIMLGGPVLFALEGVAVDTWNNLGARVITDSGLLALTAWYGAKVLPALVLDQTANNLTYQLGPEVSTVRYPPWFVVQSGAGNPSHPITAGFAGLDLFWASPLELEPPEGVEAEALFTSSPQAWLQTEVFSLDPADAAGFILEQEETRGSRILGAALRGVFPAWYDGLLKPADDLPDLPARARESRMVVTGDLDIGSSFIGITLSERNLDFLIYAADWLTSDEDIIGIRSRNSPTGRLEKIPGGAAREAAMVFSRILNLALVPLAVIAGGLLMARRRRKLLKALGSVDS
ncbi:MAG: GldG family protein [Treponema sp.]|jgi:ABC-type uncharacterized transport system involved in gliding motility auxiliary subunit|nr:GldG family protein [Treponema sp.]